MGRVIPVLGGVISNSTDRNNEMWARLCTPVANPLSVRIKNMKVVITVDTGGSDHVGSITLTLQQNVVASWARQD